jgi:hypothetical protein
MSVIRVAPIESMARRALVKNLKNHNGNSLWAINNVPCSERGATWNRLNVQ